MLMRCTVSRNKWFMKISNIKFHENPSSGSRIFPCIRTEDGLSEPNRHSTVLHTRLKAANLLLCVIVGLEASDILLLFHGPLILTALLPPRLNLDVRIRSL
jgi:hypothetical protein